MSSTSSSSTTPRSPRGRSGWSDSREVTGARFELQTLILALLAGAVLAIAVGTIQLPSSELSRGCSARHGCASVASFAVWRAAQIGLRPGSQALVRTIIVGFASYEALGQLESARLLLAPVLTVVNGAGVYLLPTYSAQAKAAKRFSPAVPLAMATVGLVAAAYGLVTIILRQPLSDLLTDGSTTITVTALLAWTAYSIGFGAGVPVGNAIVARGRSRAAFDARVIDAAVGITAAAALRGAATSMLRRSAWRSARWSAPHSWSAPPPRTSPSRHGAPRPVSRRTSGRPRACAGRSHHPLRRRLAATGRTMRTGRAGRYRSEHDTDSDMLQWEPAAAALPRPRRARSPGRTQAAPDITHGTMSDRTGGGCGIAGSGCSRSCAIVATEYKFRRRDIDDALDGSIDLMILTELGVYGLIGLWAVWRLAPTRPRLTPLTVVMWGYILTTAVSALVLDVRDAGTGTCGAARHHRRSGARHRRRRTAPPDQRTAARMDRSVHGLDRDRVGVRRSDDGAAGGTLHVVVRAQRECRVDARTARFRCCSDSGCPLDAVTIRSLPWPRWTYGALLVVHIGFVLATRTRGSIGGAFVAIAVMAWIWTGQRAKPQLVLGSLVVGGACLLAFGGPVLDFLTRGESAEQIGTFNRRTEIWSLAWESFLSHPLHGLGFTSAKGVFFDETGLGGAHNALFNVMIDTGLAGLIWWIALLVSVGVAISRVGAAARRRELIAGAAGSARADHLILLGMFTASIVNSITTEGLGAGVNVSAIWLYLMVAWICVLRREARAGPDDRISIGEGHAGRSDVLGDARH